MDALAEFQQKLILKRYSKSTISTYTSMFKGFLCHYTKRDPLGFTEDDVRDYLMFLMRTKGLSRSVQNQCINALKFYLEHVLKRPKHLYPLERPKKEWVLPKVMHQQEVANLFAEVKNIKHRAMLYTIYSGGLRISELCRLRIQDIDSRNMFIQIKGGKGAKDRQTLLSATCLSLLRQYWKTYRPKQYLFEGQKGGEYSPSSLRQIFNKAKFIAGLNPEYTVHSLRHSFATHLLEQHVNLRYIQVLMGHNSSKTTEIYTHVAQVDLKKIKSPLDNLNL